MSIIGNVGDVAEGVKIVFLAVVIIIISTIVISNFEINLALVPDSTAASEAAMDKFDNLSIYWDWGVLLLAVGLIVISVVVAKNINISPGVLVITFLFMSFMLIGSAVVSNLYNDMIAKNADFALVAADLPISQYLLDHLVQYSIIYIIIVSIVLFTKQD